MNPDKMQQAMQVAQQMQNGGIKQALLQPAFEDPATGTQFSQAELVADIINILRIDTKQIARLHGVEVKANQMTPERAAELIDGMIGPGGTPMELVDIFEDIEDKRGRVLRALMDEAEYQNYLDTKKGLLYSVDVSDIEAERDGDAAAQTADDAHTDADTEVSDAENNPDANAENDE